MAYIVILPRQSLQMTEGTIERWLKAEGDAVAVGEPLFEMETDKLSITIDAAADGTLLKILRQAGETVPITTPIAVLGAPGEDYAAALSAAEARMRTETPVASSPPGPAAPEKRLFLPEARNGYASAKGSPFPPHAAQGAGRTFASPRARTVAERESLDWKRLHGSGPDGLVIERDVLAEARRRAARPAARQTASHTLFLDLTEANGYLARLQEAGMVVSLQQLLYVAAVQAARLEKLELPGLGADRKPLARVALPQDGFAVYDFSNRLGLQGAGVAFSTPSLPPDCAAALAAGHNALTLAFDPAQLDMEAAAALLERVGLLLGQVALLLAM